MDLQITYHFFVYYHYFWYLEYTHYVPFSGMSFIFVSVSTKSISPSLLTTNLYSYKIKSSTWPALAGVVPLVVLADGTVEAGLREARWQRCVTVSAGEGCVRAVTAVAGDDRGCRNHKG